MARGIGCTLLHLMPDYIIANSWLNRLCTITQRDGMSEGVPFIFHRYNISGREHFILSMP